MKRPFEFTGRVRSFKYAFRGVYLMIRTQHNAWIHAAATVLVVFTGFALGITSSDWCWIVIAIGSVWIAEALNTSFEFLADVTTKEYHPEVEKSKDVAAGAVLISAIVAVVIGGLVFTPYFLD